MVNMGISHHGAFLADLVFDPRDTEALQGNISLPAFRGTVCERLRDLDSRTDRFGYGISQGQKISLSIPVYNRGDICHRQRDDDMVICEHYRHSSRRSGIHAKRSCKQPYGHRKRNQSRARRVDP